MMLLFWICVLGLVLINWPRVHHFRRPSVTITAILYPEETQDMSLHSGKRKKVVIIALDANGHVIPLENPSFTDPTLELVEADEVNTYFLKQSPAYDGTIGQQVPCVFVADGHLGEGVSNVSVDFGTETLYPGDVVVATGTLGEEEDEPAPAAPEAAPAS